MRCHALHDLVFWFPSMPVSSIVHKTSVLFSHRDDLEGWEIIDFIWNAPDGDWTEWRSRGLITRSPWQQSAARSGNTKLDIMFHRNLFNDFGGVILTWFVMKWPSIAASSFCGTRAATKLQENNISNIIAIFCYKKSWITGVHILEIGNHGLLDFVFLFTYIY